MAKLGIFAVVLESLAKIGDVVTDNQEDPLAKVAKLAAEPIIVGAEQLIKTTGRSGGKSFTGYAKKSDLDELDFEEDTIPQNFAGLEAQMVPTRLQEQLFRIVEVNEDEDCVTITARHVWYDNLENYTLWKPEAETQYSAAQIARNILSNAISTPNMRVASDCTDKKVGKDLDFERKNLVESFLDPEKGLCAMFGLSLIRNNWDCYVLKNVGYNRGFVVQNEKNLLGVERTESIENLANRVIPYGKNAKGEIVWLNNNGHKWVDSPNHFYDYVEYPKAEMFDTGLQIGKDGVTADNINAKLLAEGQKRFSDDKVDIPTVEMTIEFLSLGDTEEYAQYRDLDKVYLYDILSIKDTVRGYQYTAQVVAVEHDILTGMLNSVTIGQLNNWDGTRKIATWQVPEVNGENIRLQSILAGSFAPGAIYGDDIANGTLTVNHLVAHTITADAIAAHTITANEISSHTITSDEIDVDELAAAFGTIDVLTAAIADISEATIQAADISVANIKDLTAENFIAHDAITDRYFIDKLSVRSAQMVQATVGELIVKAADNHYYRLTIDENGELDTEDVTNSLTSAEIAAGETADGHSAIIETDLTVGDLSATNMKAINALIDKITASRIDVDELFARTATITALNTVDIRGNTYLQLMVEGYGSTYVQWTDPADDQTLIIKNGDVWYKGFPLTYDEMAEYTHAELASYTHKGLEGYEEFIRQNNAWELVSDPVEAQHTIAQIALETAEVAIRVNDTWEGMASLRVQAGLISQRVSDNEGAISQINTEIGQIELSVADKYGKVSGILIETAGVQVNGNKYINLDVNANNYVHINEYGIEVKGNRVKVNGKEVFARDDIIILSNGQSESTVISSMSGQHDWVLIKPYYNAEIDWTYGQDYRSTSAQYNTNVVQLAKESTGAASFGTGASWYQYVLKADIVIGSGETHSSGAQFAMTLSNARGLTNAVTGNATVDTSGNTATFSISSGHVSRNLCGEGESIWLRLDSNYAYEHIRNIRLECTCDSTTSRVPCTVYYFP